MRLRRLCCHFGTHKSNLFFSHQVSPVISNLRFIFWRQSAPISTIRNFIHLHQVIFAIFIRVLLWWLDCCCSFTVVLDRLIYVIQHSHSLKIEPLGIPIVLLSTRMRTCLYSGTTREHTMDSTIIAQTNPRVLINFTMLQIGQRSLDLTSFHILGKLLTQSHQEILLSIKGYFVAIWSSKKSIIWKVLSKRETRILLWTS